MIQRLEQAIERIVEGSVAGVFRLRVQPAEIGRRLERAMLDGRRTSMGKTLGPNDFDVRLHPEDAAAFASWRDALCRELERWLAELAFARGISTVGSFQVTLLDDPQVRRRSVAATARFNPDARASSPVNAAFAMPRLRLIPAVAGARGIVLDRGPISVGRDRDNALVIPSPNVSRRHARLAQTVAGWSVVDLGSTNGTWLNGRRVEEAEVEDGDELAFGGVRFTIMAE